MLAPDILPLVSQAKKTDVLNNLAVMVSSAEKNGSELKRCQASGWLVNISKAHCSEGALSNSSKPRYQLMELLPILQRLLPPWLTTTWTKGKNNPFCPLPKSLTTPHHQETRELGLPHIFSTRPHWTSAKTQGLPNSSSSRYHQSFLPRTICDMRGFT